MDRTALLLPMLAFAAGALAAPQKASAQCRLCDTPSASAEAGTRASPVALEVETSLDFDRLVLLGAGEGSATLLPDGSRSVSGTIGAISGRAMVGSVVVRGEPGRWLRVELPSRIVMHSLSGGTIVIEAITSTLPSAPRLNSSGVLAFSFGGRLRISGDAEGDYRGDVPITVDYQ
jgi:hypothetical protein